MDLELQNIYKVNVFLIAHQCPKCDGLSFVLKGKTTYTMLFNLQRPFSYTVPVDSQSRTLVCGQLFSSEKITLAQNQKPLSSRGGTKGFWFQVLCFSFCALPTVYLNCAVRQLLVIFVVNYIKASSSVTLAPFQVLSSHLRLATGYHIGQCRYRILPSLRKFVCTVGL